MAAGEGDAIEPPASAAPASLAAAPESASASLSASQSAPLPPPPPGLLPPPPPVPASPYAPAPGAAAPSLPPVTAEVLAIPLGIRDLLRQSLDLLTRSDNGLRAASFYIGLMMLVTVGPAIALLGVGLVAGDAFGFLPGTGPGYGEMPDWMLWAMLAAIPAYLGYIAAATEARAMATAVIGGRIEGRPLRLRESIAISRRRFWRVLGVQLLFGAISTVISLVLGLVVLAVLGQVLFISDSVSLVVALAVGMPFVYSPASVILGEVGVLEAVSRSVRLVRLRTRLAVVVTLFGVFGQFIVLFGLSAGVDVVARLVDGSGLTESFPTPLVVPIVAALVFALGTLTFLVEAIAAAPAVHAFEALTHYTRGLEVGRQEPVAGTRPWDPWFTKGLALGAVVAFGALVGGVLSLG